MIQRTAKLAEIKPNPRNPRVLKDARYQQLKKSIESFPEMLQLREIVVDENMMILGGNMRYRVMKDLGIKECPVKVADDLTDDQKREFIIKDNVQNGEWDFDMLANEWDVEELMEWGVDIPDMTLPDGEPQKEPELKSECLVEIRLTKAALNEINPVLNEWAKRGDITIDIS